MEHKTDSRTDPARPVVGRFAPTPSGPLRGGNPGTDAAAAIPAQPVVGRFAPTPSGNMHLGNVFAALIAWLSARSAGGRMLLRMENLDTNRTSPAFARQIMDDLDWLGLDWDERVPDQSARTPFYEAQQAKLAALGLVYPCFCSRAELHAATAPHAGDGSYVYDGRCGRLAPGAVAEKRRQRPGAVRVRVPGERVAVDDLCQGRYEEVLAADCGDFIIRRSDGVFAYQLAAPADDGAQGVTQVVRGRDLLPSAPRQAWLMRTLGYTVPAYGHLPLLLAPDGRRLSKRDGDLDVGAIRARHKAPNRLLGVLAHLAGLLEGPVPVTAAQLVPLFEWSKMHKQDRCIQEDIL